MDSVLGALETPPKNLSLMCSVIYRYVNEESPTSLCCTPADYLVEQIHPAMRHIVTPVVTPADGSCLFHAVSITVCGTTALTYGLRVLSALLLAQNSRHLQECGAERQAIAAGDGSVEDNVRP